MQWKHYLYVAGLILVIILIILYIIGKRLQVNMLDLENAESFDNPLEIKKDMIDRLYAKIYNKVFDEFAEGNRGDGIRIKNLEDDAKVYIIYQMK